jgi:hypothetical protein
MNPLAIIERRTYRVRVQSIDIDAILVCDPHETPKICLIVGDKLHAPTDVVETSSGHKYPPYLLLDPMDCEQEPKPQWADVFPTEAEGKNMEKWRLAHETRVAAWNMAIDACRATWLPKVRL